MKRIIATEHQEQVAVIDWFERYARTRGLSPTLLFAIPNGAYLAGDATRRAMQMIRLKRSGLRAGMPDLMLAISRWHARPVSAGLFVEMKRAGGTTTVAQETVGDILHRHGYRVIVAQGADEAIRAIRAYIEK